MKRWALGTSLQTRRVLACSILLAVLACGALPGVSQATRKFSGYGFTTVIPSNWSTGKGKQGSTRVYGAASKSTKPTNPANTMQLGVSLIPVTDVERQLGRKIPSALDELLAALMQPPQQAQNAQITSPFRSSTLGGRPAASGALQYVVGSTQLLQSGTVSVYRGKVYFVSYSLDMANLYKGLAVLKRVHSKWHWRR